MLAQKRAARLAVVTAPVGVAVGYVAQLTLLVFILIGMLTLDRRADW